MGFLEFVPEELRERVGALLQDDVMSYEDKVEYFTAFIEDKGVLANVLMCLEKPKTVPPDPEKFLSLMTSQRKILAQWALDKGDFNNLGKYISHEEEAVQLAYAQWKQQYDKTIKPAASPKTKTKIDPSGATSLDSEKENESEEESEIRFEPEENPIIAELFNSFPDGANLLILGCTGTGKSTFINSLANYLKHSSFESASVNGVDVLIETSFEYISPNQFARRHIECNPTIFVEQGEPNENTKAGQSSTQLARSYKFEWGPKGQQKTIRIIDTPGVNDVRGAQKEKENFKNTLKFLAGFKDIHGIIILLKANDARCTQAFRYCINELLSHLHESASKNILFCFTHNVTPGDTLATLEAHLEDLENAKKIKIPLTENNMFCYENDSFRALCAMTKNVALTPSELNGHKRSWARSVSEIMRMFKAIAALPVHRVHDTLSVNNIREVILVLARPLAEISREIITNRRLVDDKQAEINTYIEEGTDLQGKLYMKQQVTRVKEIDYPMTVCNSCASYEKFSPTDQDMQKVFPRACHDHCFLEDVEFIDHTVKASIDNKEGQVQDGRDFIARLENRRTQLENQSNKISKYSAEFSAFLRQESLLSYNDAYGDYINYLIQEERDKVSFGGSSDVLTNLEKFRDDYAQEVAILTKHDDENRPGKSIEEIYRLVEELKSMPFGSLLQAVQDIEFLSVRNHHETQSVAVNLNSGSFASKVKKNKSSLVKKFKQLFEERR